MAGFLDKLRLSSAAARLVEERLYEQVVRELSEGQRRDGLWAKAIADCDGSEERSKALYIKYRVQSLKDELEVSGQIKRRQAEEEEAAAARRAESAREARRRAESARAPDRDDLRGRIKAAEKSLESKGYKLGARGREWVVIEPLGGRHKVSSLDELEEYVRAHAGA